jgi:fructose-specific phosphotransferase system IIC component
MQILVSNRFRMRRRTAVWLWRLTERLPGNAAFKGAFVKMLHEGGFWLLIALYFAVPASRMPIIAIFLVAWISQLLLGACIVTIIERMLTNDRTTIMDPWLRRFGLPCTHRWRMRLTLIASSSALLVMLLDQL